MSVDLWTVILTIASFFVLYFLLNTFLFKPLIKFMDDRKARIDAGLEEGKKAKQAMEESQRALESEIRGTGTKARQILAESKSSDVSARAKVIEEARGDAAAAAITARQRVAEEEQNAVGEVENRMSAVDIYPETEVDVRDALPDDVHAITAIYAWHDWRPVALLSGATFRARTPAAFS